MAANKVLLTLATFRENLVRLMRPEVLEHFAKFLDSTGNGDNSMLERYKWFVENSENGSDCRYAKMASEFFLKDQAKGAAEAVVWLYHNWAKHYNRGE